MPNEEVTLICAFPYGTTVHRGKFIETIHFLVFVFSLPSQLAVNENSLYSFSVTFFWYQSSTISHDRCYHSSFQPGIKSLTKKELKLCAFPGGPLPIGVNFQRHCSLSIFVLFFLCRHSSLPIKILTAKITINSYGLHIKYNW